MGFRQLADGRCELSFRDGRSRSRQITLASRVDAEVHLMAHAGQKSEALKRKVEIAGLVHSYLQDFVKRAGSKLTQHMHRAVCELNLVQPLGNPPASQITVELMLNLVSAWKETNISEYTIADRMRLFERVFEHGLAHGVVATNVAKTAFKDNRPSPPPSAPPLWPSTADIDRLRRGSTSLEDQCILEIVLSTRPTSMELAALRWPEIVWKDEIPHTVKYLFLRQSGVEWRQIKPQRSRELELDAAAGRMLEWFEASGRPAEGYVFPGRHGGPRCYSHFNYVVQRLHKAADMPIRDSHKSGQRYRPRTQTPNSVGWYQPKFTLNQLGNAAVVMWYRQGHQDLSLQKRLGCSIRALKRWEPVFRELDLRMKETGR